LVGASLAVGILLGCAQSASIHEAAAALAGMQGERVELEVLEDSASYGFGESALVRGVVGGSGPLVLEAQLGECGPLLAGERIIVDAQFKAVDVASDRYAWQDGACGALSGTGVERRQAPFPFGELVSLRASVIDRIGAEDDRHALLQALVCGYRRNVRGTDLYASFQACGLAHLVAVSGAHLVIVTGLFASVLRGLKAPRKLSVAVLMCAMGSYYVLSGMPVSALRAAVMSSLGLLSFFGRRRPSSLNAIGIALFAIVAADPPSSISVSLALSVLSTVGIVVFGPLLQAWIGGTPLNRLPMARDALALTLAASLLSQLYACSLFNMLPLIAPLANVVTAPLFPLVCGSGLVSGMLEAALGGSAVPMGEIAAILSGLLAFIVTFASGMPFASVPFTVDAGAALAGSALVAMVLWVSWPRPNAKAVLAFASAASAVILAFVITWDNADRIVMLDVGQGDSIYVQSRGQTLLVDTGNQDAKLLHGLARNHVAHLDSVLVSHADDDHCGSLDQLQRSVDVDRAIVASELTTCDGDSARSLIDQARRTARSVVGADVGDSFKVGAFMARVVWPRAFTEEGGNADSLCILLEYDGDDDGTIDFRTFMTG
ncbi:MAG: ComEC/Rec2 family competence protein, partial [Eggerthellaceae bacterium]|nr:ComEC/Rec2 family competence protein [Eggerthellaceae bacterium]